MDMSRLSEADLEAIAAGDMSKVSDEALTHLAGAAKPKKEGSWSDPFNAAATGLAQGVVNFAGLPVDTLANVVDLGKAALGTPFLLAGKVPPEMLQLGDRADVPLSAANMTRAAEKTKAGRAALHAQNPDYEGGYIQAMGRGLAGAFTPTQAAMGVASSVAGKAGGDAYGPMGAIVGGALPTGAVLAAPRATRYAIRGGEQGRQNMADRLQTLRDAGVNSPTLGLASGNGFLSGLETLLQKIPGSMGSFARARDEALNGMQSTVNNAAETASTNRGSTAAGTAIQNDLNSFHKRVVQPKYVAVNDRAEGVIGTTTPIQVENAVNTTGRLSTPDPSAPATTGGMVQPRIASLHNQLRADQGGAPAYTDGAGMYHPEVPPVGIPYGVVKDIRSGVGREGNAPSARGEPIGEGLNSTYAALSDDMRNAAAVADLNNGQILQTHLPSSASGAFERGNKLYSSGMKREERTAPFADKKAPEDAFNALNNSAMENISTTQAVNKSITPATRGSVAGTIIERLGMATDGNQTHLGDVFSPQTFLTNWNKLGPRGQQEMFSGFPNAPAVMAEVQAVAEAASMMKDHAKHWANPSGTAANARAMDLIFGAGAGGASALAGFGSPAVPAMAIGTMGLGYGATKAMTNPNVVRWASERTPQISVEDTGALTRYLVGSGLLNEQRN